MTGRPSTADGAVCPTRQLRALVNRFLLAADGEHEYRIQLGNVAIQRDVTTFVAPDHELPQVRLGSPTDQRIAFQHIDGPDDVFDARRRVRSLVLNEMFQDAIEIIPDLRCEFDARHY